MIAIPEFSALRISQDTKQTTKRQIDSLDHLLVVAPKSFDAALFSRLPLRNQLIQLHTRARKTDDFIIGSRVQNARATGLTLSLIDCTSAFARLTWARKTLARCVGDDAGTLGLLVVGLPESERMSTMVALVSAAEALAFQLPRFKSKRPRARERLRALKILGLTERLDLEETSAIAVGNNLARWLTTMPPNMLPAAEFRKAVFSVAEANGFEHEFIGEIELAKRNAGAFLAVSQGNADREAGIVHLRYVPKSSPTRSLALVGKGILFDTGGNNLKHFKAMLNMHMDMQGSAVALGTMVALARMQAPFAIDAWLAVTENRISATAYKSQDVVTASNGKTIQVIHTDAEGRMVLADTLAFAAAAAPDLIIDYATLTGACVTALTSRYSGVFTNRDAFHAPLIDAGRQSGERVWPFPMDDDLEEPLHSDIADIKQCAVEGAGDHIIAARFLSNFVPANVPWVHLDLSAAQNKGGLAHIPSEFTGFGVRLTVELLKNPAVGLR